MVYRQVDELRFPGDPLGEALSMLLGTAWATYWWAAVGGATILLAGSVLAIRGTVHGWWLAAAGLLPLVVYPGLTGHANAADARYLALGLDTLHVVAAGSWIGALGVIVLVGRRSLERLVAAFSPMAMISVAILLATGALASWREIGSLSGYGATDYGRLLLLKVALFGIVAALGAINWRRLAPRLGTPHGDRAMVRSASLEFLIGQVVLLVTAVLVRTSP
jgi:putative copper export protein